MGRTVRGKYCILFFLCVLLPMGLCARPQRGQKELHLRDGVQEQPADTAVVLSVGDERRITVSADTVSADTAQTKEAFRPDPEKVVWLGAIIPGFGDIVNRKYWKLPIVYGAYMGCAFAVTWFSTEYNFYKTAYRDIIDTDPTTNSHLEYLDNRGITLEQMGGEAAYRDKLRNYQDNYRRYRDYSILFTVAIHGLAVLWAYVDAQLYDFDISPDLSMHVEPAIINNDVVYARETNCYDAFGRNRAFGHERAFGVKWNIRIK